MRRAWCFVLCMAILAAGACFAQAGARQEMVPAPVRSASAPAVPAHPSPYNFPGVQYPRIEADSRVTFHFNAPNAQKVQVSIVNVPFDMVKGDDGVWTYTSAPQAPGYHNYWMIVDGAIVLDPGTQAFIGYGHMCNGFEVPEPGVDFYDLKDVPHGNVLIKNYFAKTTNSWRHIFVYTPPGYDANLNTRYPVLYLQHGGGEDERVWIEMGRTNVILDNLIAAGQGQAHDCGHGNQCRGRPGRSGGRPGSPVLRQPVAQAVALAPGAVLPPGRQRLAGARRRGEVRNRRSWGRRLRAVHGQRSDPLDRQQLPHAGRQGPPGHGGPFDGRHADRSRHHGQPRQVLLHRLVQRRRRGRGRPRRPRQPGAAPAPPRRASTARPQDHLQRRNGRSRRNSTRRSRSSS